MQQQQWNLVGNMPDPAVCPRLKLKIMKDNKIIEIEQNIRNNMEYYFELDLNTEMCIKKQYKSQTLLQKSKYITIATDHRDNKNINFDVKGNLYLKCETNWYVTKVPMRSSIEYGPLPYVLTPEKNHIILFTNHNIFICDINQRKWYESNITLPTKQSEISSIIVPTLTFDYQNIIYLIISHWSKNVFSHEQYYATQTLTIPTDLCDVIINYYSNYIVYIFGGMITDKFGSVALSNIYKIELMYLFNNMKELKSFNTTVDIKNCRFYLNDVIQVGCYCCFAPNRDCICLPCGHICVCHECMEYMPSQVIKCILCGKNTERMYQLMY
eukprot:327113_1